ncbi:MAG TPA: spermidine synthase, partial [Amycolatopsis sp.]|nr:spermidine synthase [Amycolatopsis sp.]
WRNQTLIASWRRFTESFGTVLYYGSDEHEWAFLSGRADVLDDPGALVAERIGKAGMGESTLDEDALRANTVPPFSLRRR